MSNVTQGHDSGWPHFEIVDCQNSQRLLDLEYEWHAWAYPSTSNLVAECELGLVSGIYISLLNGAWLLYSVFFSSLQRFILENVFSYIFVFILLGDVMIDWWYKNLFPYSIVFTDCCIMCFEFVFCMMYSCLLLQ